LWHARRAAKIVLHLSLEDSVKSKLSACLVALAAICGLVGLTSGAQAQYRPANTARWEQLGCVEVGHRPDFDVVTVGRREGRFRAIMLSVSGKDIRVEDLRVIYGNGQPDHLPVRAEIRAGGRSQPLDLQGRDRVIERIEIISQRDYRGQGHGKASVCVSGLAEEVAARPPMARWEVLGCQQVGMSMDRDIIRVGRQEGRFRAIRLEVGGNDVHIENLTVMYANGERDQIPVRAFIRQGTMSSPLDLRGDMRAIERIELIYRAVPNNRGTARVCASGLAG
jgi:hypothetical protein